MSSLMVQRMRCLSLGCLLAITMPAWASDNASPFEEANRLYAQGKYEPAAQAYEQMLRTGLGSSALFFNAGNAWFKAGNLGKAIADYLRARELAPRDSDIRANLRFVRSRINPNNPNGGDRWQTRLNWLTWNEWCAFSTTFIWILFGLLIIRQWRGSTLKSFSTYIKPAGFFVVLFGLGLAMRLQVWFSFIPAVVTVKEAAVRYGPLDDSRIFYQLNDGMEVEVVDQQKDWVQIKDSSRRIGWLRADQLRSCQIGRELIKTTLDH
jgi:tetratricopeptide (TPR) repeat protein